MGLVQGLVRRASEGTDLQVLQAGPEMIVLHTLMGLRALDARTGESRWSATLPTARAGVVAKNVRLYPSLDKTDRIYVSFDDRLDALPALPMDRHSGPSRPRSADGSATSCSIPRGSSCFPKAQPEGRATGSRTVKNGVVQTGLNVARYEDGTTIASKPLKMRGDVMEAMIAGDAAVLAVDAESKTFVNVLDVAAGDRPPEEGRQDQRSARLRRAHPGGPALCVSA